MAMTRFHALAIAAGLLLALSQPSFAAKRLSDTKTAVKSQSRAAESKASAIRPYSRDSIRMVATTRMPPGKLAR